MLKLSQQNLAAKSMHLHKVRGKIEKIQSRIEHISKQKESFGIAGINRERGEGMMISANERLRWWRQPSPNMEEDDLVELVEDTNSLIAQLSSMELSSRVVSIVGMGGLGKTTLAKRLYNHSDLGDQFDCKAFVYVSKEYRRKDTLRRIIKEVSAGNIDDFEKLEEEEMVKKLHQFLKGRRYLVVLDDVWEKEVWDSLQAAFPSGMMGSKVMLTTRNREVALHADARSIPHEPRLLTEDESFKLFRKKALPGMDHMPCDLEKLGREMVVKCGGLPLAVVVLAGLLSTKLNTAEEWERVLENISWRLIDQDRLSAILALSYNDLPFHLKSCFLHLALFPEDDSIKRKKLMRLWVAEGFMQQQGKETLESVAENCLNELIDRCMIQVGTRTLLGRVKTIRIHDILREFSVSKAMEEYFAGIYTGHDEVEISAYQSTKSRRLAIHAHYDRYAFLDPYAPHLRSLQVFNRDHPKIDFIYKDFKLLRVLDIYDRSFHMLPDAIGDLIQLRYLGLRMFGSKNCKLPQSIGKLKNLQTLDLRSSSYGGPIPNVFWKLEQLRHLLLSSFIASGGNLRLDTLSHLQTLKYVQAGRWIEDGGLANMKNLRRLGPLGMKNLSPEKVNFVISNIEKLHYLQSLTLQVANSFPTLTGLSRCDHLRKLCFWGKIENLPDPCEFPPNLVKLSLFWSLLHEDPMVKLERLPNLKMLVLGRRSYTSRELVCSSQGFPQLQVLQLSHLEDLEEWTIERNAMMKLKHLKVIHCPKLEKAPEGLKLLNTLEKLESFGMPLQFQFEHILRLENLNPRLEATREPLR